VTATISALKLAVTNAFKAEGLDIRLMKGSEPNSDGDLYELFVLTEAVVALRAVHGPGHVVVEPSGPTYRISGSPSPEWYGLSWFRVAPKDVVLRTGVEIDCRDGARCEVDLAVVGHAAAAAAAAARGRSVQSAAVQAGLECKNHKDPPSRTIAQGATMTAIRLRVSAFSPSVMRKVPFALVSPLSVTADAATVLRAFDCDAVDCAHPGLGSLGAARLQAWITSSV
jgi:hypothetical protein